MKQKTWAIWLMGAAVELQTGCATITIDEPEGLGGAPADLDDDDTDSLMQPSVVTSAGGSLVVIGSGGSDSEDPSGGASAAGGAPSGGAPGAGGMTAAGGSPGTGGAGSGGSPGSGGAVSGTGGATESCDGTVSMSAATCGDLIEFNGDIYRCESQAVGVNGEPSGCGNSSVYCSVTSPDHAGWGSTAWSLAECE